MFSSKQTNKFDYFICYHLESGWHVTIPNQVLSLGRGKSLGTRLGHYPLDRDLLAKVMQASYNQPRLRGLQLGEKNAMHTA